MVLFREMRKISQLTGVSPFVADKLLTCECLKIKQQI